MKNKSLDNLKISLDLDHYTLNKVLELIDLKIKELLDELQEVEEHGSANEAYAIEKHIANYKEIFDDVILLAIYRE